MGFHAEDGAGELIRYLLHNQIDTGFFVAAYPKANLGQVRSSLLQRDRMIAFAITAQTMRPAQLQRAFTTEFDL